MSVPRRMLLVVGLLVAGGLGVGFAAWVAPSSRAAGTRLSASKVVERTLACTTERITGYRRITVESTSGFRDEGQTKWLGQVTVGTGTGNRPRSFIPIFATVFAGWPPPPTLEATGLGYSAKLCRATRARVPFSARGLNGGVASQNGDEVECIVPRTVVVRVRGVFRTPTMVEYRGGMYMANSRLDKGQLAVQTLGGKRLVYGEVLDSGRARVFTARGCR